MTPGRIVEPALVIADGGWVTSIRGRPEITIETLPRSTIPAELGRRGYVLAKTDTGERILPTSVVQHFVVSEDGKREPVTEGSTRAVQIVTHAGIARVESSCFRLDKCDPAIEGRKNR